MLVVEQVDRTEVGVCKYFFLGLTPYLKGEIVQKVHLLLCASRTFTYGGTEEYTHIGGDAADDA